MVGFGVGAAGLQVRSSPGEGPSSTTGQGEAESHSVRWEMRDALSSPPLN